jgi:multidrug efflux system membrane fusion protein
VSATQATQQDVPVFLSGLGTVTAYNTVVVKSRVDGQVLTVNAREGQEVKKGELLATIDPRPFEVQLQQAMGTMQRDQALLNTAKANLARNEALAREGVIAQQQLDQQRAETGQYEGAVAIDRAAINSAKLNLQYTRVTAPITGRVGLRQVDVGNVVHASDQNGLFVITQQHPIAVVFTLPQDSIPTVVSRMRKGRLPVQAFGRDDLNALAQGYLETLDNQIDPTTGTVKLKAVFDNTEATLWPNQFVNIHLQIETRKQALVIPTQAIQHGQDGEFVYVVGNDGGAQVRQVKVALTQGDKTILAGGVQAGEQVVTEGQDKLQPGAKVDVRQPAQRQQQAGGGGQSPSSSGPAASDNPASGAAAPGSNAANQQNRSGGNRGSRRVAQAGSTTGQ